MCFLCCFGERMIYDTVTHLSSPLTAEVESTVKQCGAAAINQSIIKQLIVGKFDWWLDRYISTESTASHGGICAQLHIHVNIKSRKKKQIKFP